MNLCLSNQYLLMNISRLAKLYLGWIIFIVVLPCQNYLQEGLNLEINCTNMVDGSTTQENYLFIFASKTGFFKTTIQIIEKYYLVTVSLSQQIDPCVTTRHFNVTFHTIYADYWHGIRTHYMDQNLLTFLFDLCRVK